MSGLEGLMNPYDRHAKLYPMVLTLLPLALGIAAWVPPEVQLQGVLGSALVVLALSSLLTQIARDQGKRREPELYRLWAGRPSDRVLSYAAAVFPPATLGRRHRALAKLDPKLKFPKSAEAEQESPDSYGPVYAAATDLLLAQTRDRAKFPLLFRENVNFGYRRNLWGMKAAGVLGSIAGLASSIARLAVDLWREQSISIAAITGIGLCACLLVLWLFRITPNWVKIPADAFARQLAEGCDRIDAV